MMSVNAGLVHIATVGEQTTPVGLRPLKSELYGLNIQNQFIAAFNKRLSVNTIRKKMRI
jgi:hypothetical protein